VSAGIRCACIPDAIDDILIRPGHHAYGGHRQASKPACHPAWCRGSARCATVGPSRKSTCCGFG